MPGQIRQLIDELMDLRAAGAPGAATFVRAHIMMRGINPDQYDASSPDDPAIIALLEKMIADFRERTQRS